MTVRVRFAPSPTGTLHLGSARTALYNWLYARHFGDEGTYVLRIEDTDQERSTAEAVAQALRVFRWLGLDWDEGPQVGGDHGPYVQSERLAMYDAKVRELLASGAAYECYCSKEELDLAREQSMAAGQAPVYGGTCRVLSDGDRERLRSEGRIATVRFRVPDEGETVVDDLIHGEKRFENALLGDFIIRRSDGLPVYNFANVVDDSAMRITHVIRGDDHLSNTPRQVLIYQALGAEVPKFAHVPMILGADRQKLSKRHGAASVEELAEQGYVAEAVRNYIALLGWSRDEETTLMSTDELVEAFDVARVRKSPAAFDYEKLKWMNGQHLRRMSAGEFAREFEQWRERWVTAGSEQYDAAWAVTPEQAAFLVQEKVDRLDEVPGLVGFLAEPHVVATEAWDRLLKVEQAPQVLDHVISRLEQLEEFAPERIEELLRGACTELDLKPRVVFGPVRFAVTGRTVTPGLFESIFVLGRERAVARLREARARLEVVSAG